MGGGRFELVLEQVVAAPGQPVTGQVRVLESGEVGGLEVQLGRVERSSGSLPPVVVVPSRAVLLGPAPVTAGEEFPFSVMVPADAAPGFTVPHGSVGWVVRLGSDGRGGGVEAELPVTVAGEPRLPTAAEIAALGAAADRSHADRPDNRRLGWVFLAIGLAFNILGAAWVSSPPSSWEEQGSTGFALALTFGLGWFCAICGLLVLRSEVVAPIGPLTVAVAPAAVRRGDTVRVSVTNGSTRPVAIGFESVEVSQRRIQNGAAGVVTHREHVLSSNWRPLAAGASTVEFTVPTDAVATSVGERITVAHRVSVVPAGKERSVRNRSRHRTPLVVLP